MSSSSGELLSIRKPTDWESVRPGAAVVISVPASFVCRHIEECWNQHDIDVADELVSPDYLNHAASAEYQRAEAKYSLNWLCSVFPDHRFDIQDAVAEGDKVAVRGTMSGTHEGDLWGIPPTGERVAAQQLHWFRVVEGKVAEHWAVRDDLGTMRQLGVMSS